MRVGSSSSLMPARCAYASPSRKSRLPCMRATGTPLSDRAFSLSATKAPVSEGSSSPTQASNRSPRMYSASAPRAWPSRKSPNSRVISGREGRSEEHTSELQSQKRISYAVFCLKKQKQKNNTINEQHTVLRKSNDHKDKP